MRRVLVIASGALFKEGLSSLLEREADLPVASLEYTDKTSFLHELSQSPPDAILVSEVDAPDSYQMWDLLRDSRYVGPLQLIIVRPDDNAIDVYERHTVVAARREDLLKLIRHGVGSAEPSSTSPRTNSGLR